MNQINGTERFLGDDDNDLLRNIMSFVAVFLDVVEISRLNRAGLRFMCPAEPCERALSKYHTDIPKKLDALCAKRAWRRMNNIQWRAKEWEKPYNRETHPRSLFAAEAIKDCERFLFFVRCTISDTTFEGIVPCRRAYHRNYSLGARGSQDAASLYGTFHCPLRPETYLNETEVATVSLVVVCFSKCYLFAFNEFESIPPTLVYTSPLDEVDFLRKDEAQFPFQMQDSISCALSSQSTDLRNGPFSDLLFGEAVADVYVSESDHSVGICVVCQRFSHPVHQEDDGEYRCHDHGMVA